MLGIPSALLAYVYWGILFHAPNVQIEQTYLCAITTYELGLLERYYHYHEDGTKHEIQVVGVRCLET